jgi:hypothetical protein
MLKSCQNPFAIRLALERRIRTLEKRYSVGSALLYSQASIGQASIGQASIGQASIRQAWHEGRIDGLGSSEPL